MRGKLNITQHQTAWAAGFSDPTAHDPEGAFRYMVNAVVEYANEPAYMTRLLANPNLLQNNLLSTSIIDQENTNVWGASGFVLNVPSQNIIAAANTDIATQNAAAQQGPRPLRNELKRLHRQHGLPAPDDVIKPLVGDGHNEIAVIGNLDLDPGRRSEPDSAVTITGIYVIVDAGYKNGDEIRPITMYEPVMNEDDSNYVSINGKPRFLFRKVPGVSKKRMDELKRIAAELGVPIIPIRPAAKAKIGAGKTVLVLPSTAILEDSDEYRDSALSHGSSTPSSAPTAEPSHVGRGSRIPGFREGSARGTGNNCLIHTLYQLGHGEGKGTEEEVNELRQALLETHPELGSSEMLGIYDAEGRTLLEWFDFPIQVIQIKDGRVIRHPVVNSDAPGPIRYLLHEGAHYSPLYEE